MSCKINLFRLYEIAWCMAFYGNRWPECDSQTTIVACCYIISDTIGQALRPMILYENYEICILMNINENLKKRALRERLRTHKVFTKGKIVVVLFPKLLTVLHKIICCGCVLESPQRGDSNTHPQHMILWRNIEFYNFLSFFSNPSFSPLLLYVRCKSGVTFVRRCFRDGKPLRKLLQLRVVKHILYP